MSNYIRQIKKNVWKWENENGLFSVKKYPTVEHAEKIRIIHHKLHQLDKSFILPVLESAQEDFIIQPWFKGTHPVDYGSRKDRLEVYSLLEQLHDTNKNIKWDNQKLLQPFDLFAKWQNRSLKMKEISYFVEFYLGEKKTKMLLHLGDIALKNMQLFNNKDTTILHGDVVHHNFLSNEKAYKIIDFDLAVIGPKEMEEILWMHRVLPAINYDIFILLSEFPLLEKVASKHKEALMYPNELYREWLYAYALPLERKQKFIDQLIPYTNKALTEWPKLCYNLGRL